MSQLGFVEVDPTSVPTPPAGAKTIFVDNTSHAVSVKDETGTVSPLGGASGLVVGGVLTGTLPNPGLAATTVVAAAYGSANTITTLTVGVDGRLTAAAGVAVAITETNITLSDITTDNVSTSKHGFTPKLPNDVTKFLNGTGGYTVPSGSGDALTSNPLSQFAATTSAQLAGVLSDETGTGVAVFATGPTLSSPIVGTQSEGDNSTKAASTAYADRAVLHRVVPLQVAISDESTALSTGTAKITFRIPFACTMTALPRANVNTVSSSGLPTFDIKKNGTTVFSTGLTIDVSEKTSVTAATPAVLSGGSTTFADDDEVTVDIGTAGTGTTGAKITLYLIPS